jgi:hypothetical protein
MLSYNFMRPKSRQKLLDETIMSLLQFCTSIYMKKEFKKRLTSINV